MMTLLTMALAGSAALGSTKPCVKVSLNSNNSFVRGENAQVHVQAAQDGYLVVLRGDAQGVRVLFPLDPGASESVRRDKKIEIRGRGGRNAFTVDERDGSGVVLAAWSATPFNFSALAQNDHWDLSALDSLELRGDQEAGLVDVVQQMAGANHFDYDAVTYTVLSPRAAYYRSALGPWVAGWPYEGWWPYYGWVPGLRLGIGYSFGGRWGWRR